MYRAGSMQVPKGKSLLSRLVQHGHLVSIVYTQHRPGTELVSMNAWWVDKENKGPGRAGQLPDLMKGVGRNTLGQWQSPLLHSM